MSLVFSLDAWRIWHLPQMTATRTMRALARSFPNKRSDNDLKD